MSPQIVKECKVTNLFLRKINQTRITVLKNAAQQINAHFNLVK